MWAILFMCLLQNFLWNASCLTSAPYIGLYLFLLVTLSPVLYFVFSCLLSMDMCTPYSMLVLSSPTWDQSPLYLQHLHCLIMQLPVNIRLKTLYIHIEIIFNLSILPNSLDTQYLSPCGNQLHILLMHQIFLTSFYLADSNGLFAKGGGGGDIRLKSNRS